MKDASSSNDAFQAMPAQMRAAMPPPAARPPAPSQPSGPPPAAAAQPSSNKVSVGVGVGDSLLRGAVNEGDLRQLARQAAAPAVADAGVGGGAAAAPRRRGEPPVEVLAPPYPNPSRPAAVQRSNSLLDQNGAGAGPSHPFAQPVGMRLRLKY